ncbi:MAG: JAB domain-containing protein [bacterium]
MLNIYCWRCGTAIDGDNILGLGQFDNSIGRYRGKGFVAFNCPKCSKTRYQILDSKNLTIANRIDNSVNQSNSEIIDIDQVIDFHRFLDEIETVGSFLEKCDVTPEVNTEINKPILQPQDVYKLYNKLNTSQQKRLMILTLDKDNYIISWDFLGEGLKYPISYDPRVIFQTSFLIEEKVSVIIAENLSRNFTEPTQKDLLLTKRLIKAGKILGIDFIDHIVISENGYHSYDQLNYI